MSGTVRIKRRASVVLLGVSIASLATACTNTNNNAVIDPRMMEFLMQCGLEQLEIHYTAAMVYLEKSELTPEVVQ